MSSNLNKKEIKTFNGKQKNALYGRGYNNNRNKRHILTQNIQWNGNGEQ